MQLTELKQGQSGRIIRLIGPEQSLSNHDVLGRRLMELGFIPGTVITAMHEAPLTHDPRSYTVRGMHVALRSYEANRIDVEPIAPEEHAL